MMNTHIYNINRVYINSKVRLPDGNSVPVNSDTENHTMGLCSYDQLIEHLNYMFEQVIHRNRKSDFESFTIGFEYCDIEQPNFKMCIEKDIKRQLAFV